MVASTKNTRATISPVLLGSPPPRLEAMTNLRKTRAARGAGFEGCSDREGESAGEDIARPRAHRLHRPKCTFQCKARRHPVNGIGRCGWSVARPGRAVWVVEPL